MKKAKPPNRCFGDDHPQNPDRKKEDKIKEVLSDAVRRDRANREIKALLEHFPGKRIIDLLPVIKRRCSPTALKVAIERVERRQDVLGLDDVAFFVVFKQEELEQNGIS